jgi:hypothetical protein
MDAVMGKVELKAGSMPPEKQTFFVGQAFQPA